MRFSSRSLLLLAAAGLAAAGPYPRDNLHDRGFSFLMPRDCNSYCGADNQYCCSSGETCTTIDDIATCLSDGTYGVAYTSTWTVTQTYTSTIMTYYDVAPEATSGVDCIPQNTLQEACGTVCCAEWQTCADPSPGQCSAKPGYEDGTTVVITSDGVVTTQYSAPYRITGTTTITSEGVRTTSETDSSSSSTATSDSDTISAGGTANNHLSAGAIAGIVIGTIAGVALLLLLCFCCIARGLWVAIFGKKKHEESRERVDIVEERYSRHGSRPPTAHSKRPEHKGWFGRFGGGGGGPASASSRRDEKRKSSGAKWLGIAGLAATLLALLNLRKDKRPSSKPARSSRSSRGSSRYSDSYYSYSDYTDPSSVSSRSHNTRRTGRTAQTARTARSGRTARTRDSRARSYYSGEDSRVSRR